MSALDSALIITGFYNRDLLDSAASELATLRAEAAEAAALRARVAEVERRWAEQSIELDELKKRDDHVRLVTPGSQAEAEGLRYELEEMRKQLAVARKLADLRAATERADVVAHIDLAYATEEDDAISAAFETLSSEIENGDHVGSAERERQIAYHASDALEGSGHE